MFPKQSPIYETKSPDKEFTGRHTDLLDVVSPNETDALKNSVAKSLETITEQPTYLEIDFFSADKTHCKGSTEKGRSSVMSQLPVRKETVD